jgi:hypothetical protein
MAVDGVVTEVPLVRILRGKTFVWDGERYDSEEAAKRTEQEYRDQGFEVQRLADGSTSLLYTRRPVLPTNGTAEGEEVQND